MKASDETSPFALPNKVGSLRIAALVCGKPHTTILLLKTGASCRDNDEKLDSLPCFQGF